MALLNRAAISPEHQLLLFNAFNEIGEWDSQFETKEEFVDRKIRAMLVAKVQQWRTNQRDQAEADVKSAAAIQAQADKDAQAVVDDAEVNALDSGLTV